MSQVIKDIEEALKREVAALTTYYKTTKTNIPLSTSFNPFTGEETCVPLTASFYDENSGANAVTYPRADITLDAIEEDKSSGRNISIWEDYYQQWQTLIEPNQDRPRVYKQIVSGRDGQNTGDGLVLPTLKFIKVLPDSLVKIVSGNNKGTYKISSLDSLTYKLVLNNTLISDIQEISFNEEGRRLYLLNNADLFNIRAGDKFKDSLNVEFNIVSVNTEKRELILGGLGTPDLNINSSVIRLGDILRNTDSGDVSYIIMDVNEPIFSKQFPGMSITDQYLVFHPMTPFNYHYTIEIKNKERQAHIATAERVTETIINRPRRAIEVLFRCPESAESVLTCDPMLGTGQVIEVESAEHFCVNDSVYLINKFKVSENNQIIDIDYTTNKITLRNKVLVEFSINNETKLVSNSLLKRWSMFLNNGTAVISQDSANNFYRQEYSLRIEGWKEEKSGKVKQGAITEISGTIETPNHIEEEF